MSTHRVFDYSWDNGGISENIMNGLLSLLLNRDFMLLYSCIFRHRNINTQHMYHIHFQYALRKISREDISEQVEALFPQKYRVPKKKTWTHPLQQQSYRKKFGLDAQHEEMSS